MAESDTTVTLNDVDETLSTTGKPREGGCLYVNFDPDNCTLPTDATTSIKSIDGWVSVGDLSQDGITYAKSTTTNKLKGHQGKVTISEVSEIEETIAFTLIEPNRPDAARLYYGNGNVVAGEDGSVATIEDAMSAGAKVAICEDSLESNGYLRRTVVPKAAVDTFTDISHKQGEFISYGVTATIIKPSDKAAKYTYRAKPATA